MARQTSDVISTDLRLTLRLGNTRSPSLIPSPSAARATSRIGRTCAPVPGPDSPWLLPSTLAGQHVHPNTLIDRLRDLGVNLLGARNRAIGELVTEVPPPLVADALGYNHQVAFKHADAAAEP